MLAGGFTTREREQWLGYCQQSVSYLSAPRPATPRCAALRTAPQCTGPYGLMSRCTGCTASRPTVQCRAPRFWT